MVEFIFKGYPYCKRKVGCFHEISQSPTSNVFHPTEIMSTICGYTFPPYGMCGFTDLASFFISGERRTGRNDDGDIEGAWFNCQPIMAHLDTLRGKFPEIYSYGERAKITFDWEDKEECLEFIKDVEKRFGKTMTIDFTLNTERAVDTLLRERKLVNGWLD